jgi:hypothetical protein
MAEDLPTANAVKPMSIRSLCVLDKEILTEIYNLNREGVRPTLWSITHTLELPDKKRKRRRTSILLRAGYLVNTSPVDSRLNLVLSRIGLNALAIHDADIVSATFAEMLE